MTCRKHREALPLLADWLSEGLGLELTATLLRQPDLRPLSQMPYGLRSFEHYPLAEDAFLWLALGRYGSDVVSQGSVPAVVIGLYAHPVGRQAQWARISVVLTGKPGDATDERVEAARTELAEFVKHPH